MEIKRIINKKGQVLNTVTATFVGLFVLVLIGFAILLGISTLDPENFFDPAGENQTNATRDLVAASTQNLTEGFSQFTGNIPTIMIILGVVMVLAALTILILIVTRIRSQAGASGSL